MSGLTPGANAPSHDLVSTPRPLALEIIDHFPLNGEVLDPCMGTGAFYDQFPDFVDKSWCEINRGLDFMKYDGHSNWIVSNPPWSMMRKFLVHAMKHGDNVVFLSTLTHFCTRARLRDLAEQGFGLREFYCVPTPPPPWPRSGFQLGGAWIQKNYAGPLKITGRPGALV